MSMTSDLQDAGRLRELSSEYSALRTLTGGITPQRRGEVLNSLISRVLQCWGIDARANVRSTGEIDVAFTAAETRFILEAKWWGEKVDLGPITKLQKRVRQRLQGSIGLLLSMSGFTPDAMDQLKMGDPLNVLLLDANYLEALITGTVPPDELFALVLDQASFRGDPYVELGSLVSVPDSAPDVELGGEPLVALRAAEPELEARTCVAALPFGQAGIEEAEPSILLITTARGVLRVDLSEAVVRVEIPVPNCSGNSRVLPDGSVLAVRRKGVIRWHEGTINSVAGGWFGPVQLISSRGAEAWALGATSGPRDEPHMSLVRLGSAPGDEDYFDLPLAPRGVRGAAQLTDTKFALVTNGPQGAALYDLGGSLTGVDLQVSNPMSPLPIAEDRCLVPGGDVEVHHVDFTTRESRRLATFDRPLHGSVYYLARREVGGAYIHTYYAREQDGSAGIVVQVNHPGLTTLT